MSAAEPSVKSEPDESAEDQACWYQEPVDHAGLYQEPVDQAGLCQEEVKDEPGSEPDCVSLNDPLKSPLIGPSTSFSSEPLQIMPCHICGHSLVYDVTNISHRRWTLLQQVSEQRQDGKFTYVPEVLQLHTNCLEGYDKGCNSSGNYTLKKDNGLNDICNDDVVDETGPNRTGLQLGLEAIQPESFNSQEIIKRVKGKDLVSLKARCHTDYLKQRRRGACPPSAAKRGRQPAEAQRGSFRAVCDYIEAHWEDSQFSLPELYAATGTTIGIHILRRELEKRYGHVVLNNGRDNRTVLVDRQEMEPQWHEHRLPDEESERLRIVRAAANIVLDDIRSVLLDNRSYPPPSSFLDDLDAEVPETLKTFVDTVVTKYKNRESMKSTVSALSHSIMTAARPRSFKSPLLVGIGSIINQNYAPKDVIDLLSSVGFCAPYKDVTELAVSVANHERPEAKPDFTQFIFDAVDTPGNGRTTQALVGMQCVPRAPRSPVPRLPPKAANYDYEQAKLLNYAQSEYGLKNVSLEDHRDDAAILPTGGDALWLFGKTDPLLHLPGWDTFMSKMSKKERPVSEIRALPVIHAPASHAAVYTALKLAQRETEGLCLVTFSQPSLYKKAQNIVKSHAEMSHVVLRLGGFQLMTSFLGAVGYIMSGSGLEQLWCNIYAPEQIGKMMTGHAHARAVRAHLLTRSALFSLITKDFDLTPEERLEIERIADGDSLNLYHSPTLNGDNDSQRVNKYQEPLAITMELLEKRGPTAQLWLQYFRMTTLAAQFIEAESNGDWDLHLSTLRKMLPYFHASGHFESAKYGSLYLQDMQTLESKMSAEEYDKFTKKGYFAVRWTDKIYADVWPDQMVERTIARLIKRPGGISGGRTVTDSILAHWTAAGPVLRTISDLVEDFCKPAGQILDTGEPNIKKDNEDLAKLRNWFKEHDPFSETERLVSLSTGVVSDGQVRCHEAGIIGKKLMAEKVGQNFQDVTYQREKCVQPLSSIRSAILINNIKVPIEPDTILKRIHMSKITLKKWKSYFEYELAPYPLSMFNEQGMLEANKSDIFNVFAPIEIPQKGSRSHVIDGEFLLRTVTWPGGADVLSIVNSYIEYVKKHFTNAVVVFGRGKGSTFSPKQCKMNSPTIEFQKDTVITISQERFFANEKNRDKFIQYLIIDCSRAGIAVKLSSESVETYIVRMALDKAPTSGATCVVSDNADLFVVMCGLANRKNIYFMKPGRGKKPTTYHHVDGHSSDMIKLSVMFIHAVSGCETTSALFQKNKTRAAQTVHSMPHKDIEELMTAFKDPNAQPEAIAVLGGKFMRLYYGDVLNDLHTMRYKRFAECATSSLHHLASLPPTKEAARYHLYRTYHQIQKWLGNDLPATKWGWKFVGDRLEPIMTVADAAPKELLDLISCKCVNVCTKRCTCKRAGLDCCVLCLNCNGRACHGMYENADAYGEGYGVLSGCDAYSNPVDPAEFDESSVEANAESKDEPRSEPTNPKKQRRDAVQNKAEQTNRRRREVQNKAEGTSAPKRLKRDTVQNKTEETNTCDVERVYIVEIGGQGS